VVLIGAVRNVVETCACVKSFAWSLLRVYTRAAVGTVPTTRLIYFSTPHVALYSLGRRQSSSRCYPTPMRAGGYGARACACAPRHSRTRIIGDRTHGWCVCVCVCVCRRPDDISSRTHLTARPRSGKRFRRSAFSRRPYHMVHSASLRCSDWTRRYQYSNDDKNKFLYRYRTTLF